MATEWGILTQPPELKQVFDVDSCVSMSYASSSKVSMFPIEQGSFAHYNKVQEPFTAKVQLAVGGDSTRMESFLVALEAAKNSITLYCVVTPEETYTSVSITDYSYQRTATAGKKMILADISLTEIRQVATNSYGTAKATSKIKSGMKLPLNYPETALLNPNKLPPPVPKKVLTAREQAKLDAGAQ